MGLFSSDVENNVENNVENIEIKFDQVQQREQSEHSKSTKRELREHSESIKIRVIHLEPLNTASC